MTDAESAKMWENRYWSLRRWIEKQRLDIDSMSDDDATVDLFWETLVIDNQNDRKP
jgi:hypothetical protein|tara:strand:- start:1167 stop:1334 length:168 start_codon:yes stop_codon:yes gene_type:complete